jgi:hypothetical protein
MFLFALQGLVAHPLLNVLFPFRLKHPRAGLGQGQAARFQAPRTGCLCQWMIPDIEKQLAQINWLEDDASFLAMPDSRLVWLYIDRNEASRTRSVSLTASASLRKSVPCEEVRCRYTLLV